ncbi:hypothetical protein [Neopusillimonas aromaticivorans]|uniref:hypothetical protein n=1 Tax=Neopusillimonas aromaticivorans TaxID=2979868 RepID=UPI00259ABD3C|nr:hypothetical protein [Neopusillimonas aromaticivorans]WJJ92654.1 hypothetical protein N7E01_09910 [Neopusillimonas aromaticivorans]
MGAAHPDSGHNAIPRPLVLFSPTPALANPVARALRQWGRTVRVATSVPAVLALPEHERSHLVVMASAAGTMPGQVAMEQLRTTLLAVRDLILAHHPKPLQVDLLTIGGPSYKATKRPARPTRHGLPPCRFLLSNFQNTTSRVWIWPFRNRWQWHSVCMPGWILPAQAGFWPGGKANTGPNRSNTAPCPPHSPGR